MRPKSIVCVALVLGCMVMLVACDPNESGVPDGIDFKSSTLTMNGDNLVAEITFYGNYSSEEFFFYISTDGDQAAEYLVRCNRNGFTVAKETSSGLYNDFTLEGGAPSVSGRHYNLEFPLSAIGFNAHTAFNFRYWFFEMTKRDRMPDTGEKVFAFV